MDLDQATAAKFDRIVTDLARNGWSVYPEFLDAGRTAVLAGEVHELSQARLLRPARVGRGEQQAVQSAERGDWIFWLDPQACSATQRAFLDEIETLRLAINREMYLGLFEYEGHLASYPPGAFYRRHLDQFRDAPERLVSCILYLNEDWRAAEGGELRLFLDGAAKGQHRDILPHAGTLVTFLSERFYHEVLPATRERLSLTGWLRARA